jgi:hypothetical protein
MAAVPWSRRGTAILAAAQVVVFVAAVVVMVARVHRDADYRPLRSVSVFGPTTVTHRYLGPFVHGDPAVQHIVPAVPGQPTRWVTLLRNVGDDAVTIEEVTPVGMPGHTRWSPFVLRPGSDVGGVALPYLDYPAVLKPHAILRIRVEVKTVRCPRQPGPRVDFQGLGIVWHALGYSHTTYLPNPELVQFCPPRG